MIRNSIILYTLILWSGATLFTSCTKNDDNFRSVTGKVDPASIQDSNYVAYFPFESLSYVLIKGKGIDSTKVATKGTLKFQKGVRGFAYQGDTTQSQVSDTSYITIPINSDNFIKQLKEFTISCWVKLPNTQNGQAALVLVDGGDDVTGTLSLSVDPDNLIGSVYDTTTLSVYTVSAPKSMLSTNKWEYITFTYENATSKLALYSNAKLLKDEVCKSVVSDSAIKSLSLSAQMTKFYIGVFPKLISGTAGSNLGYFQGSIDEMRIWRKCLSTTEINALYEAETKIATTDFK